MRQLISCSHWWKTAQSPLTSVAHVNRQKHCIQMLCMLRQKELVKEMGANAVLHDGNYDRIDLKVLGLANNSKFSTDYLN